MSPLSSRALLALITCLVVFFSIGLLGDNIQAKTELAEAKSPSFDGEEKAKEFVKKPISFQRQFDLSVFLKDHKPTALAVSLDHSKIAVASEKVVHFFEVQKTGKLKLLAEKSLGEPLFFKRLPDTDTICCLMHNGALTGKFFFLDFKGEQVQKKIFEIKDELTGQQTPRKFAYSWLGVKKNGVLFFEGLGGDLFEFCVDGSQKKTLIKKRTIRLASSQDTNDRFSDLFDAWVFEWRDEKRFRSWSKKLKRAFQESIWIDGANHLCLLQMKYPRELRGYSRFGSEEIFKLPMPKIGRFFANTRYALRKPEKYPLVTNFQFFDSGKNFLCVFDLVTGEPVAQIANGQSCQFSEGKDTLHVLTQSSVMIYRIEDRYPDRAGFDEFVARHSRTPFTDQSDLLRRATLLNAMGHWAKRLARTDVSKVKNLAFLLETEKSLKESDRRNCQEILGKGGPGITKQIATEAKVGDIYKPVNKDIFSLLNKKKHLRAILLNATAQAISS